MQIYSSPVSIIASCDEMLHVTICLPGQYASAVSRASAIIILFPLFPNY